MFEFIKTFCVVMAILLVIRRLWKYVCVWLGLRIVHSDRIMNMIKDYDPECYEKGIELKQMAEMLKEIENET